MKIAYHELLDRTGLPDAEQYIKNESQNILKARVRAELTSSRPSRRLFAKPRIRTALILAAALALLTVTAVAGYSLLPERAAELFRLASFRGTAQEIGERSMDVLAEEVIAVDQAVTSGGTTVVLESVMGYTSELESLLYAVLQIRPAPGLELPEDLSDLCFIPSLQASDMAYSSGGLQQTFRREDGTFSALLFLRLNGPVSSDQDYTLTLDKLTNRHTILQNAVWQFNLPNLALPELQTIPLDPSQYADAPIRPLELALSPFGGYLWVEGYDETIRAEVLAYVQEHYPHANLTVYEDWYQIDALYHAGILTLEEFEDINDFRVGVNAHTHRRISLLYPDGTRYTLSHAPRLASPIESLPDGTTRIYLTFFEPQDIGAASTLSLDEIEIPLHLE